MQFLHHLFPQLHWTSYPMTISPVRCLPARIVQPRSLGKMEQEVPIHPGLGTLVQDEEMQEELNKAFEELKTFTKVTVSLSHYRVLSDLFLALFRAPKSRAGNDDIVWSAQALGVNADLLKALEMFYESSVVNWCLAWHSVVLVSYLSLV